MITLRDYLNSDISALVSLANNQNVSRYMTTDFPFPYTIEDARWWISEGSKQGTTKVIEYNSQFIGSVGVHPKLAEKKRTAIIGYWLGEPYWGQGFAPEALKKLTSHVFASTDIIRLEASIYSPNKNSMKVAEKAGYHCEAVLKKAIYKNNEFYDEHIYSKLSNQSEVP